MSEVAWIKAVPEGGAPGVLRLECGGSTVSVVGRWLRESYGHRIEFEFGPQRKRVFRLESRARFGTQFVLSEVSQDDSAIELATAERPDSLVPNLELRFMGSQATGSQPAATTEVTFSEGTHSVPLADWPQLYLRRASLWGHRFILTDDAETWASIEPSELQSRCPVAEAARPLSAIGLAFGMVLAWEMSQ